MTKSPTDPICLRIAQLRLDRYGERGRSLFASALGISASTYNYYEGSRVPPADVLVRIADVAKVDLRWLLTGQSQEPAIAADHPAIGRIVAFLRDHPDKIDALTAFVELLAASLSWPAKPSAAAASQPVAQRATQPPQDQGKGGWIPILGRSAAGVPQFWKEPSDSQSVALLSDLAARSPSLSLHLQPILGAPEAPQQVVQLIRLTEPIANVSEFVSGGPVKARYPDAFAVRIDGDSMSPEIRHGDIVICSPTCPAEDGQPAIVQLANQIGVTCKLFRRESGQVHLVPINEQYPPQSYPASQFRWAVKVLALLRTKA